MAVGARTEHQAAHAQAADENGEDRGGRGRGRAEDQPEFAQPAGLVDERAES